MAEKRPAYEALARKYRPRTFDELIGQKPIVRTLVNTIKTGRIHHAYVFSGVRGVGKTTVARIFAKALNCEKGPTPTPCLVCSPCLEIAAGQDLDVIEMDAASRTGVDDVRDLIDTTRYAPARDRYKVFIIDEFHMLSRPAFNALLKTLEEPPPRVVFVMATTELHKVPSTVLSRTQQFDFRKVSAGEIADLLARIAKEEKIQAPRACLEMLARAADGSVRDSESLLDQAIAACGTDLDETALKDLLGLVPDETVEAFFAAAADRNAAALVEMIDAVIAEGHDLRVFLAGLIEGARNLLLARTLERASDILGLSAEHEKRIVALAARFDTTSLLRMTSVLMALEGPLRYSEQPRYVLEAAAIRIAEIGDLAPIEDLIARLEGQGPTEGPSGAGASTSRVAGPAPAGRQQPAGRAPGPVRGPRATSTSPARDPHEPEAPLDPAGPGADQKESEAWQAGAAARAASSSTEEQWGDAGAFDDGMPPEESASDDLDTRGKQPDRTVGTGESPGSGPSGGRGEAGPAAAQGDDRPRQFLETLRGLKKSLAVLAGQASSIVIEGDTIRLFFDAASAFARKSVEQPSNLGILREAAAGAFGRTFDVEVVRTVAGGGSLGPAGPGAAPGSGARPVTSPAPPAGSAQVARSAPAGGASRSVSTPPGGHGSAQDEVALEPAATQRPRKARAAGGPPGPGGAALLPGVSQAEGQESEPDDDPQEAAHGAAGRGAPPARHMGEDDARRERLMAEALEDPVVKDLLRRFEGRIVEIKEAP